MPVLSVTEIIARLTGCSIFFFSLVSVLFVKQQNDQARCLVLLIIVIYAKKSYDVKYIDACPGEENFH